MFQFTSGLCLTNQLYLRNMSMLFKSVTAISICSICLLIFSSSSTNLVTFPFLVLSVLKTSNDLSISSVLILSFFTSCLLIPVWVQIESTSALSHSSFLFDILTFVHTFNFLSLLSHQYGIIYQFWDLLCIEVCYSMLTPNFW